MSLLVFFNVLSLSDYLLAAKRHRSPHPHTIFSGQCSLDCNAMASDASTRLLYTKKVQKTLTYGHYTHKRSCQKRRTDTRCHLTTIWRRNKTEAEKKLVVGTFRHRCKTRNQISATEKDQMIEQMKNKYDPKMCITTQITAAARSLPFWSPEHKQKSARVGPEVCNGMDASRALLKSISSHNTSSRPQMPLPADYQRPTACGRSLD